ncbi:MAG: glycoside hydrolase family 2 TIM barrel-domain containing protein [Halanaerobiaceae bacterium]
MNRLFEQFKKRKVKNLDGIWDFVTDPEDRGLKEKWYKEFPEESRKIMVPSCWNNEWNLYHYEGTAWYAKTFESESSSLNLKFNGFTGQIEVYLDGEHLGGKYGGFTGFECLATDIEPGKHQLVVSVDNTHNDKNTIPLSRVDWFHYGGLFRSVEVMELEKVWIKDYKIEYKLTQELNQALLDFTLNLEGLKEGTLEKEIKVYINGNEFYRDFVEIEGETRVEIKGRSLTDINLWEPENPALYEIRFEIEDDDITERIGFRKIETKKGKLFLNNQEIQLKGVNRHEDHPDWGFALPFKLMKKDIDIIENMGGNTIRGSHYPNAEVLLDYLDETGILFWEEIPMWGFKEEHLEDPLTKKRGLAMHEAMVKRDYHHPSIVIWGLHNEIDTTCDAAYDISKAFSEKIKEYDQTRPLTFASFHPLEDVCFPFVDIVSVNKYFGWYYGETEDWSDFLDKLKDKLEEDGLADMPIIISEFGAGAVAGESTFEGPKWTENFQEKYLDKTLKLFLDHPDVIGTYIWQYCDIRTAQELEMGRPRSFNNKGLVNEYRKPKLGYWKARELYKNY